MTLASEDLIYAKWYYQWYLNVPRNKFCQILKQRDYKDIGSQIRRLTRLV